MGLIPCRFGIAIGANLPSRLGRPPDTLRAALSCLSALLGPLEASRLWANPAFPSGSGPDFVNAVAVGHTVLPPAAILGTCHAVEGWAGRARGPGQGRWAPRALDVDLLFLGDAVLPDRATQDRWRALAPEDQRREAPDRLILPHPRIEDRAFVLVPLLEVAPDWTSPATGRSAREALAALPAAERASMRPLPEEDAEEKAREPRRGP